jgi:hypothetical protein
VSEGGESPVGDTVDPGSDDTRTVFVLVATAANQADADGVVALLEDNGFLGFTTEPSDAGVLVLARGLTPGEANDLVVRLFADQDVPFKGVVFEED